MDFILQNEIYYKIINEVRTPTGRISETQNAKFFYILHRINYAKLFEPTVYEAGVPMNYEVLESILMLNSGKVKKLLCWLVNNEIIRKEKNYSTGFSSNLYKLHPRIENMPVDSLSISSSECKLVEKIERFIDSGNLQCDVTEHQFQLIKNCLIVNNAGVEYLKSRYPDVKEWDEVNYSEVKKEDYILFTLFVGQPYCRRNANTKRIYSSLTNISSRQRNFLTFNSQPLHQIDLKNAQVLLSVGQVIDGYRTLNGTNTLLPPDILKYKSLAETGSFYEYMASRLGVNIANSGLRAKFKERFFKQVFYSRIPKIKTQLYQLFEREFPNVLQIINVIKHTDYRNFAIMLQKLEAEIFVDEALRELYSLGIPALTIHDSIVVSNRHDLLIADEILNNALMKRGLLAKFKQSGFKNFGRAA